MSFELKKYINTKKIRINQKYIPKYIMWSVKSQSRKVIQNKK